MKGQVLYNSQFLPVRYYIVWVREVNETPNFFNAFTGKDCAKSNSGVKQPISFIVDKKSTVRWSDNKIVDFINTQRIEVCLPFVSYITGSIHSCFLDDFV